MQYTAYVVRLLLSTFAIVSGQPPPIIPVNQPYSSYNNRYDNSYYGPYSSYGYGSGSSYGSGYGSPYTGFGNWKGTYGGGGGYDPYSYGSTGYGNRNNYGYGSGQSGYYGGGGGGGGYGGYGGGSGYGSGGGGYGGYGSSYGQPKTETITTYLYYPYPDGLSSGSSYGSATADYYGGYGGYGGLGQGGANRYGSYGGGIMPPSYAYGSGYGNRLGVSGYEGPGYGGYSSNYVQPGISYPPLGLYGQGGSLTPYRPQIDPIGGYGTSSFGGASGNFGSGLNTGTYGNAGGLGTYGNAGGLGTYGNAGLGAYGNAGGLGTYGNAGLGVYGNAGGLGTYGNAGLGVYGNAGLGTYGNAGGLGNYGNAGGLGTYGNAGGLGAGYLGNTGLSSGYAPSSSLLASCRDRHTQCAFWASTGECGENPLAMRQLCPISCGTGCQQSTSYSNIGLPTGSDSLYTSLYGRYGLENVGDQSTLICRDSHEGCQNWAGLGLCPQQFMLSYCRGSCGYCGRSGYGSGGATMGSNYGIGGLGLGTNTGVPLGYGSAAGGGIGWNNGINPTGGGIGWNNGLNPTGGGIGWNNGINPTGFPGASIQGGLGGGFRPYPSYGNSFNGAFRTSALQKSPTTASSSSFIDSANRQPPLSSSSIDNLTPEEANSPRFAKLVGIKERSLKKKFLNY